MLVTAEVLRRSRPAYARAMKAEAKKNVDDLSMHPLMPVQCNFPFVLITEYLDVYSLIIVKPMHFFHLVVSRMLKNAAADFL